MSEGDPTADIGRQSPKSSVIIREAFWEMQTQVRIHFRIGGLRGPQPGRFLRPFDCMSVDQSERLLTPSWEAFRNGSGKGLKKCIAANIWTGTGGNIIYTTIQYIRPLALLHGRRGGCIWVQGTDRRDCRVVVAGVTTTPPSHQAVRQRGRGGRVGCWRESTSQTCRPWRGLFLDDRTEGKNSETDQT